MIVDTSALLAIFFDEPDRDEFLGKIGAADLVGIGAPTLAETAIVLAARLGEAGPRQLAHLVERADMIVVPFDGPHWQAAAAAWLRFGRGRHEAALNLGDCLTYATARLAGRPLLFNGNDFALTDSSRREFHQPRSPNQAQVPPSPSTEALACARPYGVPGASLVSWRGLPSGLARR